MSIFWPTQFPEKAMNLHFNCSFRSACLKSFLNSSFFKELYLIFLSCYENGRKKQIFKKKTKKVKMKSSFFLVSFLLFFILFLSFCLFIYFLFCFCFLLVYCLSRHSSSTSVPERECNCCLRQCHWLGLAVNWNLHCTGK